MKVTPLTLPGVMLIEPQVFFDNRGYFYESFNESLMHAIGVSDQFVQDNQSMSLKGVLRGLHFQNPPFAQGKLVRVTSGAVNDVIVDIRKNSPAYGKSLSIRLDAENRYILWIPEGFAHGFLALEENTILMYKVTNVYNKESEQGILWNDPDLAINWGISNPVVSAKDMELAKFNEINSDF
jgi:dTDP-4-dehydrorhamnose 3,5-epimerase